MSESNRLFVRDLLAEATGSDAASFQQSYPGAFLVLVGRDPEDDEDGDLDFYTESGMQYDADEARAIVAGTRLDPSALVFPVVKRQGANLFSALITAGRGDTCDLVLRSKSISKFHAYIARIPQLDDTFQYQLADGGSRNGTKINDVKLKPKELVALSEGDLIDLAGVILLKFFTAAGMWNELAKLQS
jgi:pSer/pThr/pTyr-binding forkhead associated (FHA) protein